MSFVINWNETGCISLWAIIDSLNLFAYVHPSICTHPTIHLSGCSYPAHVLAHSYFILCVQLSALFVCGYLCANSLAPRKRENESLSDAAPESLMCR